MAITMAEDLSNRDTDPADSSLREKIFRETWTKNIIIISWSDTDNTDLYQYNNSKEEKFEFISSVWSFETEISREDDNEGDDDEDDLSGGGETGHMNLPASHQPIRWVWQTNHYLRCLSMIGPLLLRAVVMSRVMQARR